MRKIIGAINMTLDGFCDHTSMIADDEIHDHYTELLRSAGTILYGRITYQLMQYWQNVLINPSGNKSMDEFAVAIDNIPKIVFSSTLKETGWRSASLAKSDLKTEVLELQQQEGHSVLAGSRSLIIELLNMNLIDQLQLCIQPIIAGKGLSLFEKISNRIPLELVRTKKFESSGSMLLYYEPVKK